jgi:26S proteasome regulatory subunit N11
MAELKWRNSNNVYKPTDKDIREFLQENRSQIESTLEIQSFYTEIREKPINLFVYRKAENQLINHLTLKPNNETCGVLVGKAYFCPHINKYYTEIIGAIAAPYTLGNQVHCQFTPECWPVILRTQKQDFPGNTIVGWYHSHPGHGIFLSGTDLDTQRSTFKQIWQISTVYDTLQQKIGYFYSASGIRIEPIYLGNSSAYEQLKWGDNFQQTQPGEEQQQRSRELQLPPVPPSQQVPHRDRAILLQENPARPERNTEHEENQVQNRLVILLIIALALALLPLSLLTILIDKISESYPQNTPTPKYQTEPKLPDPPATPETQPIESQTPESDQLESSESESSESESSESEFSESESQSQQPKP